MYQQKRIYDKKNYLYDQMKGGRDLSDILWNILNRIDEFTMIIENYLKVLEDYGIIRKEDRKEFLKNTFKHLYDDIFLNSIINIEGLDLGNEYLKEKETIIKESKSKLSIIKENISKEIKTTFTFPNLVIYNVGYTEKNKDSKRYKQKKPGRPKLIAG